MKQSQTCPKCQAQEVVHIPGKSQKSGYDVGRSIRAGRTNANVTLVDVYVYGSCGYTGSWAASSEELHKIKKKLN